MYYSRHSYPTRRQWMPLGPQYASRDIVHFTIIDSSIGYTAVPEHLSPPGLATTSFSVFCLGKAGQGG
jgi:hypothetical protein